MNNTQLILKHKINALKCYDYLIESHNETKDIKVRCKKSYKKMITAQVTIYAGIYNRDYQKYKKGVDMFAEIMQAVKEEAKTQEGYTVIRIKQEDKVTERDCMNLSDWCDFKYDYYKNYCNQMPKGYFKKK